MHRKYLMHQLRQFIGNRLHHDAKMIRCIDHTVMPRIDASIIHRCGESMHQSYLDAEDRCINHTLMQRIDALIIRKSKNQGNRFLKVGTDPDA